LDVLLLRLFTIVVGCIVIVFIHYGRWMYCYCVCSLLLLDVLLFRLFTMVQ
jgi:hypothetical protein